MTLHGHVRLIPSMSDQYFRFLMFLARPSQQNPHENSIPAVAVLMSAAGFEAYVNELINMAFSGEESEARRQELRKMRRTDVVAKLLRLRDFSKRPDALPEETVDDLRALVGFRGLLAHYDVQEEHPVDTQTSLQRLADRLAPDATGDIAFYVLVTPIATSWARDVMIAVVKGLYEVGYEPPRPRWIPLVDPDRWAPRN